MTCAPRLDPRGRDDDGEDTHARARRLRAERSGLWVELEVQRAIRRGDFDDLPGAGKRDDADASTAGVAGVMMEGCPPPRTVCSRRAGGCRWCRRSVRFAAVRATPPSCGTARGGG
ncbi:hypothetical protein GCM10009821_02060 [Aeromicrobium halocynthiae]|uniref:DUF1992 domain-containing protein n=1 Tax=Aeromicrobium halocynthiae TaxID=560557 RepID=A0ABN2VQM5_9ACTN